MAGNCEKSQEKAELVHPYIIASLALPRQIHDICLVIPGRIDHHPYHSSITKIISNARARQLT